MHIQQEFMNALKLDLFKEISEKSFLDKNGIVNILLIGLLSFLTKLT